MPLANQMRNFTDYNLLTYNTFGIEAKCHRFIEFDSEEELITILFSLSERDKPLLLLGGGSNLLLTTDYPGTVLHSYIKGKEVTIERETVYLRCGSGEVWDDVVAYSIQNGWYGMENLSWIPGQVGASGVQNIGAYGIEVKDLIETVEAVEIATGKKRTFTNTECEYAYRQSKFKNEWRDRFMITYVTYRLSKSFSPHLDYGLIRASLTEKGIEKPTAKELRELIIDIRKAKLPDPKDEGNAGSFFMNPIVDRTKFKDLLQIYPDMPHYIIDDAHIKIPAGWMIEQCGWKGKTLGKAGVHSKQALVLVNKGGATGQDVVKLYKAIQADIFERFGITLKPEVNIR
jgi:UDP-N-acetylmuramate dehydrogenase